MCSSSPTRPSGERQFFYFSIFFFSFSISQRQKHKAQQQKNFARNRTKERFVFQRTTGRGAPCWQLWLWNEKPSHHVDFFPCPSSLRMTIVIVSIAREKKKKKRLGAPVHHDSNSSSLRDLLSSFHAETGACAITLFSGLCLLSFSFCS